MKQSRIALVEASFSVHTRIIALMESYRSHYVVEVLDKMFGLLSVIWKMTGYRYLMGVFASVTLLSGHSLLGELLEAAAITMRFFVVITLRELQVRTKCISRVEKYQKK